MGFESLSDIKTQDVVDNTGAQMAAVLDNGADANLAQSLRTSAMDSWKSAALEKRQIALEGRGETRQLAKESREDTRQLAKEGRLGVMEQAERERIDALYADPESRESKALELERLKAEASISKDQAAAGKYGAEGKAATSKAQSARITANKKTTKELKDTLGKLNDVQKSQLKDLNEELANLIPGDDDKRIRQIRGAKNAIYMAADPEAKAKYESSVRKRQELLDKKEAADAKVAAIKSKPPVRTSKIGNQGFTDVDIARISSKYPGQVLSKQRIAEIVQAEKLQEEVNKPKTLNPNLFNGGLLESLRVPR